MPAARPRRRSRPRPPFPAGVAALQQLVAGNARLAAGTALRVDPSPAALAELAEGQQPVPTVLGCSDSRVPPELVLDQRFGDLPRAGSPRSAARSAR